MINNKLLFIIKMSKQKNNISNNIQSGSINDDTNFKDTDEVNEVIDEQNPILDFEIFEKINKFKNCVCKFEITSNRLKKMGLVSFVIFHQKKLEF